MGQERLGGDLTIAVDPQDSSAVWVAWCDRVGGPSGTDWTLHVRHSTDRGQTWSADVRTITNVKNPSLAVNTNRQVGLLYQQYTGTRWATQLEISSNAWATAATVVPLHTAPSTTPARTFLPYLGDYARLLAVGTNFFGVFCGNNTPDPANFPSGIAYQRNANWTTHTLLSTDNTTPVAPSIDPFFFQWAPPHIIISPHPIVGVEPITREPIIRQPQPVARTPVGIDPGPVHTTTAAAKKPAGRARPRKSSPGGGTEIKL